MIQIDKGIPVPERRNPGRAVYPFADMAPGDSFFLPQGGKHRAVEAARKWRARHEGFDFVVRPVEDGHRLWRTA